MADSQWDKLTKDFDSGLWIHPFCQLPFMEAKFKRFVEEKGGAMEGLRCGLWNGQAYPHAFESGYVLAFDVSENTVEGTKMTTDKFLHSQALPGSSKVDVAVASATNSSSIPGVQEGTFDLAIGVYLLCNVLYKDEVLRYMLWNDTPKIPLLNKIVWGLPKEDGIIGDAWGE